MEEELGEEIEMPMELELAQWDQEADTGELELMTRPTPPRIRKLEEELGAVLSDHKQKKLVDYEIANVGAGIRGGFGSSPANEKGTVSSRLSGGSTKCGRHWYLFHGRQA